MEWNVDIWECTGGDDQCIMPTQSPYAYIYIRIYIYSLIFFDTRTYRTTSQPNSPSNKNDSDSDLIVWIFTLIGFISGFISGFIVIFIWMKRKDNKQKKRQNEIELAINFNANEPLKNEIDK